MKNMVILLGLILFATGVHAMTEPLTLEQLAHGADAIYLGKIIKIKSVGKLSEGPEVIANLFEISQSLKGDESTGKKVKIKTFSGITDNVTFNENADYLLFLKKTNDYYEIYNGLQGCWAQEKDQKFSGMGQDKTIADVKAAIESKQPQSQPGYEPLSF